MTKTKEVTGNTGEVNYTNLINQGTFVTIPDTFMSYNKKLDKVVNLFLDDIRTPRDVYKYTGRLEYINEEWAIVRSYISFCAFIDKYLAETGKLPDKISFDHDLCFEDQNKTEGFREKTGMDCARYLVEVCMNTGLKLPEWRIHSFNMVGARNIQDLLSGFSKAQGKV